MISTDTLETLKMLRRTPRFQGIHTPHKRPAGGRVNPCVNVSQPRHGAAIVKAIIGARPNKRKQQIGGGKDIQGWKLVTEAVLRGDLPVGVPIREGQIRKVIERTGFGGMEKLALTLAENKEPIRLREAGGNNWIIALV